MGKTSALAGAGGRLGVRRTAPGPLLMGHQVNPRSEQARQPAAIAKRGKPVLRIDHPIYDATPGP